MASGPIVGEGNDGARERQRYAESKVYTRKSFKGPKNNRLSTTTTTSNNNNNNITNTAINATADTTTATNENNNIDNNKNNNNNSDKKDGNNNENNLIQGPPKTLESEDAKSAQQQLVSRLADASDVSSSLNKRQPVVPGTREQQSGNGVVKRGLENRVKINLVSKSKQEMRELRRKWESELSTVRSLVKKIEAKEAQIGGTNKLHSVVNDVVDNGMRMVHSEVASGGVPHEAVRLSRPLNQLSISVLENSQGQSEHAEKEKRTPKANQFYRNSEFLLAKDKFPPAESNKKSKMNGKKHGGDVGHGFGPGSKFFKSCSSLLEKLMKHKHGWVFNTPVDVKGLGLHDYFTIIKHPMDLGTVKSRLNKNWYKSPKEFAEDVRLTFRNAMTYNPKGQDVHIMADQLSQIFEDKWVIIESDYAHEMRFGTNYEMNLHMPPSRKATSLPLPPPLDMRRILDRSESITHPYDPKLRATNITPSGRTPVPKKPKAKDPHKRDMTYDEKQKLSTNLQNLPSEKLDNILQIIKKRNASLFQHDDEIEVDIDSVDTETLWELDRFITNYKKSLSKYKRKAERAIQARAEAERNIPEKTPVPPVVEMPKEIIADKEERIVPSSSPVQVEKQGDNGSRSSSSSSSSSDSGSSSSDSDSDSSSASGSDAGHSH
ncbi:Bromodomain domain-containing protein [Cephalotus follicularis]|uniref:Bromodomain domain-containing protein n=1 Tax=Cephalotus follicularis TaxID=3775 RepID=A0A1Q3AWV1_CEPFO|nr:Bromodomain domain-containing protein [Cephalotus follicularis]